MAKMHERVCAYTRADINRNVGGCENATYVE